jgi:2-oxo-4-hydroxy-4-carboxy--5-ureidoimidazoline (OHCU) decarboxylase
VTHPRELHNGQFVHEVGELHAMDEWGVQNAVVIRSSRSISRLATAMRRAIYVSSWWSLVLSRT